MGEHYETRVRLPPGDGITGYPRAIMKNKSFVGGLVLGIVIGFAAGVLAEKKGCPPVPAPAATSSAEPLPVAPAPEVKP